jgi:ABC-type sugar transport system permease subunit
MQKLTMQKSTIIVFLLIFSLAIIFIYGMIGWNVFISFTDYKSSATNLHPVGFYNYHQMINDPLFLYSFLRTILLFSAIPISLGVGLFLAILLNQNVKGTRIFMIIFLLPFAFSLVITGIVFLRGVLDPTNGALSTIIKFVTLGQFAPGWNPGSITAMFSIILATVWQFSGYCTLILYAGLRLVPKKEIDAAKSRGMSTLRIYREKIFPCLAIPILTSVVVLMIFTLKTFDLIYVMNGVNYSTTTLPVMIVNQANFLHQVAYGAALGNILVLLVLLIVIPYLYLTYRKR